MLQRTQSYAQIDSSNWQRSRPMIDADRNSDRYMLPVFFIHRRSCWSLGPLLLGLMLLFCSACAQNASGSVPKHQLGLTDSFFVTFVASVSYEQALEAVTNLGLQPALYCGGAINNELPAWQPMGQRDTFQNSHGLFFVLAILSLLMIGNNDYKSCQRFVKSRMAGPYIPG